MARRRLFAAALLGLSLLTPVRAQSSAPEPVQETGRPNILLIVADDMAYSDLGAFGGEINTPNLDRLAQAGTRFTDFHAAPTCSPTRSMLLTGNDNHAVGVGTMEEMGNPAPGYEGVLNRRSRTMAEIFRDAGYATIMAGKWHLGKKPDQLPSARGFDLTYTLLDGGGSHFGDTSNPALISRAMSESYRENGKTVKFPSGSYTGDVFTDHLIAGIAQAETAKKPFLAYLAFTEPHWPLQAPPELIARYKGRYDGGPAKLREERLKRMRELDIIGDVTPHAMIDTAEWDSLSPEKRAEASRAMEIYAAMVERVDQNVGRILAHLEQAGTLDNTVILFLSDNGPDGSETASILRATGAAGPDGSVPGVDNSLDNMGRASSFVAYGQDWAQAGAAPFNRIKGYTTEGGIRVVALAAGKGIASGHVSRSFLHVMDVLPTLISVTGIDPSLAAKGGAMPPSGRSFASVLKGEDVQVHRDDPVGWELFFGRAIRDGDWKAVKLMPPNPMMPMGDKDSQWELYDLSTDPGETRDLSKTHPEKLRQLVDQWNAYAERNGVIAAPPPSQMQWPGSAPSSSGAE